MRNLIVLFMFMNGFLATNANAQATSMHKTERTASVVEEAKIVEDYNKKPMVVQFEIKTIVSPKGIKLDIQKFDLADFKFQDKSYYQKIESLNKLNEMTQKENFQFVLELSKLGFRVVSHTFQVVEDREIHYYIVEL